MSASSAAATWRDRKEFEASLSAWAERIEVTPQRVVFRHMTKKWASCSTEGMLTFNLELLGEDRAFGEAVIVHELLHLIVPNHGRLFQSLLDAYLPSWRTTVHGRAICGALR